MVSLGALAVPVALHRGRAITRRLAFAVAVTVAACSSPSSGACADAVATQASLESELTSLFEEHAYEDQALSVYETPETLAEHEQSATRMVAKRIELIVAEAATHDHCG